MPRKRNQNINRLCNLIIEEYQLHYCNNIIVGVKLFDCALLLHSTSFIPVKINVLPNRVHTILCYKKILINKYIIHI